MKKIVLLFMILLIASPAIANITILNQYPGAPYTNAYWDFARSGDQLVGDDLINDEEITISGITASSWSSNFSTAPAPTLTATLNDRWTGPSTYIDGGWYEADGGYLFGHQVIITIPDYPNAFVDNVTKIIQVEVSYIGHVTDAISGMLLSGNDVDSPSGPGILMDYIITDVNGNVVNDWVYSGVKDITLTWYIRPQPAMETINLYFENSGASIFDIEVATVCVPAPGAILLGSLGCGLVGWLRRRRNI